MGEGAQFLSSQDPPPHFLFPRVVFFLFCFSPSFCEEGGGGLEGVIQNIKSKLNNTTDMSCLCGRPQLVLSVGQTSSLLHAPIQPCQFKNHELVVIAHAHANTHTAYNASIMSSCYIYTVNGVQSMPVDAAHGATELSLSSSFFTFSFICTSTFSISFASFSSTLSSPYPEM